MRYYTRIVKLGYVKTKKIQSYRMFAIQIYHKRVIENKMKDLGDTLILIDIDNMTDVQRYRYHNMNETDMLQLINKKTYIIHLSDVL